jgi:hypothetical protein
MRRFRAGSGGYTVWRGDDFIYVCMSSRGARREDLVAVPGHCAPKGLWTRLNSHSSGRPHRGPVQCHICDRFIVPVLAPLQQREIGAGRLLLGQLTSDFIRENFSHRVRVLRRWRACPRRPAGGAATHPPRRPVPRVDPSVGCLSLGAASRPDANQPYTAPQPQQTQVSSLDS